MSMTLAGWPTKTTRDRLNGLCELVIWVRPFSQMKNHQYFRDKEIESDEIITISLPTTYQTNTKEPKFRENKIGQLELI